MDDRILGTLLQRLLASAEQRPDLLSESQGGPSFGSPEYRPSGEQQAATFAGRMVRPGESLADVLSRFPQAESESGGLAMQAPEFLRAAIPIGLWKAMTPEAKAMLTDYANKYPQKFNKVLKDPQDLFVTNITDNPDLYGEYKGFGKAGGSLSVREGGPHEKATMIHELQHYLDRERAWTKTNPRDAEAIAILLEEQLAKNLSPDKYIAETGSLQNALGQLSMLVGVDNLAGRPKDLLMTPSWINNVSRIYDRNFGRQAISPYVGMQETARSAAPLADTYRRLAMDESLAYLAQHTRDKDAPSMLKLLAARLGILPE